LGTTAFKYLSAIYAIFNVNLNRVRTLFLSFNITNMLKT